MKKMANSTADDKPAAHVTAPSIPINGFETNANYLSVSSILCSI